MPKGVYDRGERGRLKEPRVCPVCDEPFMAYQHHRDRPMQKYCSRKCSCLSRNTPEHNGALARRTVQERAAALRERGDRAGTWYRKVDGTHEHRTVMEKVLGRPLLSTEIVHHIDGRKRNNHPDNLVLLTRSEHAHLHNKARWDNATPEQRAAQGQKLLAGLRKEVCNASTHS